MPKLTSDWTVQNIPFGNKRWIADIIAWRNRDKWKSDSQKEKDFTLYQTIRMDSWSSTENCCRWNDWVWPDIIPLVQNGATLDYVSEHTGMTAYMWAILKSGKSVDTIITELHTYFPAAGDTELAIQMAWKNYKRASVLLKNLIAHPIENLILNPVYTALAMPNEYCVELIPEIVDILDQKLLPQIEVDLQMIKNMNLGGDKKIRNNLSLLITAAKHKNVDLKATLKEIFGNKYYTSEPLTWRYNADAIHNKQFIATYFKQRGISENITVEVANNGILVRIIYQ